MNIQIPIQPTTTLDPRRHLRLSYSTLELANKCERLLALKKFYAIDDFEDDDPDDNPHFTYGTALGAGLQTLLMTEDLDAAIFEAFKHYSFEETDVKCFEGIVKGLMDFHANWDYDRFEVATMNGKAAVELSFKVVLDKEENDYYCGFVDVVLIDRITGTYYVVEIKTTGLMLQDLKPLYSNSAQGLGYTILLDHIKPGLTNMGVLYFVFQLKRTWIPEFHIYPFVKTTKQRLGWLLTLKLDYDRLVSLIHMQYYPMRGSACLSYMKPCQLYGVCDIDMLQLPKAPVKPEIDWSYTVELDTLIEEQMEIMG